MTAPATYRPAVTATRAAADFVFTSYLVHIRPNICLCGNAWSHSELFEVWLPKTASGMNSSNLRDLRAVRLTPNALAGAILRQGPIGKSVLPPIATMVCAACIETAEPPRLPDIEPLSRERWLQTMARKAIPEVAAKIPGGASPKKSIPSAEDMI